VVRIQVYGTGCPKCEQLEANAVQAVESSGVEAEVIKVKDIAQIAEAGVMLTPALAIDGEVKVVRKVASVDEIASWLKG